MSRVLVTVGPGVVGSRVIIRLLAAGRMVRTMVENPTRATVLVATDRDHDPGRFDAAAGCEFVDDRIRRRD